MQISDESFIFKLKSYQSNGFEYERKFTFYYRLCPFFCDMWDVIRIVDNPFKLKRTQRKISLAT